MREQIQGYLMIFRSLPNSTTPSSLMRLWELGLDMRVSTWECLPSTSQETWFLTPEPWESPLRKWEVVFKKYPWILKLKGIKVLLVWRKPSPSKKTRAGNSCLYRVERTVTQPRQECRREGVSIYFCLGLSSPVRCRPWVIPANKINKINVYM